MESGGEVTDRLQLPRPCSCVAHARTYEQRLRIRRNCLTAVYTIRDITNIDHAGPCPLNTYIQLIDGGNPAAIVTIQKCTEGNHPITLVNAPVYTRLPKNPVRSTLQTGAPGPTFTLEFTSNSCCNCGSFTVP